MVKAKPTEPVTTSKRSTVALPLIAKAPVVSANDPTVVFVKVPVP